MQSQNVHLAMDHSYKHNDLCCGWMMLRSKSKVLV